MTANQGAAIFLLAFLAAVGFGETPPKVASVTLRPIEPVQLRGTPLANPRALCRGWVFPPDQPPSEANMRCVDDREAKR